VGAVDDSLIAGGAPPPGRGTYQQLSRKVAQQGAVAELGRLALTGADLRELFDEAVRLTAFGLGTDLAAILQPDDVTGMLTCRANVGWRPEMIRPVPLRRDSQMGLTYLALEPVVVDDLATDDRFPSSRHLVEHGLASSLSFVIRGDERPRGVLAAHSREPRQFNPDDVLFVRGIANVVAAAIGQHEAERARVRSEERLEFLADASHTLATSLDLGTTMNGLARLVVPRLADWCVVHLPEGDELVPVALAHADPAKTEEGREVARRFPVARDTATGPAEVFRSGRSLLVADVTDELLEEAARGPEHAESLRRTAMRSVMVAPLVAHGNVLGTITFVWAESGGRYDEADVRLAEELGRRAGLAIDNARTHEAELHARDRAERLQRVTARLADTVTPEGVYEVVLNEGIEASGASFGLVAVVAPGGEELEIVAARGYEPGLMERWRRFPLEANYPLSEAVRTGEGVYCLTVEERDRRYPGMGNLGGPSHSLVCLPVTGSGSPIGGLVLTFADERRFDEAERRFLAALATQCGQALERARLAAALAREREQFATVLQQMPSGVVIVDAQSGRMMLANEQLEVLWGTPLRDVIGAGLNTPYRGFHLDGGEYDESEWPLQRALAGEVVVNEPIRIERPDGSLRINNLSAAPIRDETGAIIAAVAVSSDVTEEHAARAEAERRAEAAVALAFVADGVCLVDADGIVRLWNDAAARATGRPAADAIGAPLAHVVPGWDAVVADVPLAHAPDVSVRPATLPFEDGGHERWLSIAGVAFDQGVVYAFRDVTEERRLDTLKSDFIATVSHELRTPLAAIYGAATTLRQRSSLDPDEQRQFLAMIEEQAERLSRIVNEILVASRLESGELAVSIDTVDAREVAAQVLEVARRGAPDFEFSLHVDDEAPPVLADADRLRQVLGNLLENAHKYSDGRREAQLHVQRSGHAVRFVVRDYGIGIPPADQRRIFEKFYRVDPAMTGGVSGTGLGLYIVRELVHRMDGRIHVESAPGEGSSFVVELPAAG